MVHANVLFNEEKKGYDKEQVSLYIKKLSKAYQSAYNENMVLQKKYDDLLLEQGKLKTREPEELDSGMVTKILMDTEMLAQKIINDANNEAIKAKMAAKMLIDEANAESARIMARAKINFDKIQEIMGQTASKVQSLLIAEQRGDEQGDFKVIG